MLIQVEDLCKTYQSGAGAFEAVKSASFSIDAGEYVCIAGRSGSGKSTLLNMITGLTMPTSGKVLFNGNDLWQQNDAKISHIRNMQMSYMMQGFSMLNSLTLLENVMLSAQIYQNKADTREKARSILARVDLAGKEDNYPRQLSGGEVRRGMIARALINDPAIFISDEPTDGLDETTAEIIMQLFDEIHKSGVALLVVSHEKHFLTLAQHVLRMDAGHLTREDNH